MVLNFVIKKKKPSLFRVMTSLIDILLKNRKINC